MVKWYIEDGGLSQKSVNNIRYLFIQEGANPAQIETVTYSFAPSHRTELGLENNGLSPHCKALSCVIAVPSETSIQRFIQASIH